MALRLVSAGILLLGAGAARTDPKAVISAQPAVAQSLLRGQRQTTSANSSFALAEAPSCQCMAADPAWKLPTRTTPKCIFIDLGAANGNTFGDFMNNKYGNVKDCAHGTGDYEAYLVEANPRFAKDLHSLEATHPGKVHALASTAAYMCEGTTSFYLDTANHDVNYWGSSMSSNHPDTVKSGHQKVTVPTSNLMRLLTEHTIAGDWVMVKMDIEGAEWDIMPCLAESPIARMIDRMYIEQHPSSWSVSQASDATMNAARTKLASKGVDMPGYFSNTF